MPKNEPDPLDVLRDLGDSAASHSHIFSIGMVKQMPPAKRLEWARYATLLLADLAKATKVLLPRESPQAYRDRQQRQSARRAANRRRQAREREMAEGGTPFTSSPPDEEWQGLHDP